MNNKTTVRLFLSVFVFLLTAACFTVTEAQEKISFSGYGATGIKIYDRNKLRKYNQETYYEGKLQADIKINKDIDAQVDMRGSSEDGRMILREFSVKFDYFKYMKIKAGNLKKPFGQEQLLNTEDLPTIDRSYIRNVISDFGYGGRSVSLMAYYNYKEKNPEFPFSYYLSFYKDNSLFTGTAARLAYHNSGIAYALNYQLQNKGGEEKITTYGVSADISLENKGYYASLESIYAQDPIESIRRRNYAGIDNKVFTAGLKATVSANYAVGGRVVESVEPVILGGLYIPDSDKDEYRTYEILAGVNVYLDKDVRLRLNGDALFTKNLYDDDYSTIGSKVIAEIQVKF